MKVFTLMGEVDLDIASAAASLQEMNGLKARPQVDVDTAKARRQAAAMEAYMGRMSRTTARPKVDAGSIQQAQRQVQGLDKALDRAARTRKIEMKADLAAVTQAFGAGRSISRGGISGLVGGASVLGGMGGMGMMMAGAGAATAVGGAVIGAGLKRAISEQKLEAFMPRAYGASGAEFVATAKQLSDATGFLAEDFMRASLIGKQLSSNYGLQTDQVAKLVAVSADLAATSPYEDIQTAANAMERLQSAVRGEAEASERLGLTLNDTYMKNMAANGAYRATWTTMNDLEKAQARYREILVQTQSVLGASEDEGMSKSLRLAQQRFTEAGTALSEKLLPVLSKLVELAAKIPAGVYEGAMWGGLALGGAMLGRGAVRMGRSLMGGVGEKAVTEAATAAAAKAAEKAAAGAAAKAAAAAATKGAASVVGDVAGSMASRLISQSAVSAIASVGGLAVIAGAAALVAWAIKDIAKETNAQYDKAEELDEQRLLMQRYSQQKQYGIDWGVYRDAEGKYVQGTIQGVDQVAGTARRATTIMVDGKPRSGVIVGSEYEVNRFGRRVGAPYYGEGADQPFMNLKVTLQNQSSQPLKAATDAGSYAPSNY